ADTYTIASGVSVGSDLTGFNNTTVPNTVLDNSGNVFGMGSFGLGVVFGVAASGGAITNETGGFITGYIVGVAIYASGVHVTNYGTITGIADEGYETNGNASGNQLT